MTSLVPAAKFPVGAVGVLSQVCCLSSLGCSSLAATLLVDVNHPGSQEDLVSSWELARSLVEDAISGAEIAPSPSSSGCYPPASASGGGWANQQLASSPLVFAQSFVL